MTEGGGTRKEALTRSLRDSIQASLDHAEAEHRRELFRRRLDLARQGLQSYRQKQIGEAVRQFLTYIKILENWKKVGDGQLNPACFDVKVDAPELLLISGVYWDLAKLFDRSNSPENHRDCLHYLNQFVNFSRGMPFEALSSESLRKYLRSEKPVHKAAFKAAYAKMGGTKCFVVTSLLDHVEAETLFALQDYRDEVLARTFTGRAFTRFYYTVGPFSARMLNRCPEGFRRGVARLVTFLGRLSEGSCRFGQGGK